MDKQMEHFEVRTVPLRGKNLVEASAGTGKTYSIAILVLRLIIEQHIGIGQQLIVTFTRFAVAELQERIRHFIKMAYDASCGLPVADSLIRDMVAAAPQEGLKDRLRAELLLMDEANIMTIHGFSQQMLSEFAFETKQHFDASLQSDLSDIIQAAVNRFWRTVITNLPPHMLSVRVLQQFREQLPRLLAKQLSGQQYAGYDPEQNYQDMTAFEDILSLQHALKEEEVQLRNLWQTDKAGIELAINQNAYARKSLLPLLADEQAFIEAVLQTARKGTAYIRKLEGAFWDTVQQVIALETGIAQRRMELLHYLSCHVIQEYARQVTEYVQEQGILTFDAMIRDLHQIIVTGQNDHLAGLIRARYAAVFIDEFQDTDNIQFELFERLFIDPQQAEDTILFLIGDPKQSIYAFRNADVDSYLAARKKVEQVYTMNINYRSTEPMIQAVNYFFGVLGDQAFGYESGDSNRINYIPVRSKDHARKLLHKGQPDTAPLCLAEYDKAGNAHEAIAREIATLLHPDMGYRIQDATGVSRPIQPSDIGILVRSSKDGAAIKKLLRAYNVLAVPIDDTRILRTPEARDMALLLRAMLEPTMPHIMSALYLSCIHTLFYEEQGQLLQRNMLDEVALTALFRTYHQLVLEQKVYQAFQKLFADFSIPQKLSHNTRALRTLANLVQLTQLMHQQQYWSSMHAEDLLLWLQHPDAAAATGDAYEVQLESDENAVSIVTIHKSKGLEYNLVFVYGVHGKEGLRPGYNQYKDSTGQKIFVEKERVQPEQEVLLLQQAEQEQRRLLYVALTRSVYKCYLYYARSGYKDSGLSRFVAQLEPKEGVCTGYLSPETAPAYQAAHDRLQLNPVAIDERALLRSRAPWQMVSYSALNVRHESVPKAKSDTLEGYDDFIFNQLPRGTDAGTQLHEILEQLDFTRDYRSLEQLNHYERMLLSVFNVKVKDTVLTDRTDRMRELVAHIVGAVIPARTGAFTLSEIPDSHKLNELEFNFPVRTGMIQDELLTLLQAYDAGVNDKYYSIQGMMNGKIDLLFAHADQYFVLDWKSNYLGCNRSDYEGAALHDAMTEHNYHLQYLIYSVATHKYLQQRLGADYDYERHFGGIIYVFFRGVRSGSSSGIYTFRPPVSLLERLAQLLYV